jgi:hypothetical protein
MLATSEMEYNSIHSHACFCMFDTPVKLDYPLWRSVKQFVALCSDAHYVRGV